MKSILKATKMCGWIVVILRSHFLDYAISPRIKTVKMGYFAIGGVVCSEGVVGFVLRLLLYFYDRTLLVFQSCGNIFSFSKKKNS